jgi:hypothetical protein
VVFIVHTPSNSECEIRNSEAASTVIIQQRQAVGGGNSLSDTGAPTRRHPEHPHAADDGGNSWDDTPVPPFTVILSEGFTAGP